MRIRAFAIGLALAWAAIGGARAADVLFTITGGGQTATFKLPLNPTPNFGIPGVFFLFSSVPAVVDGVPTPLTNLIFWKTGGFTDERLFNFSGPQFYTGSESSPTFLSDVSVTLHNNVLGGTMDRVTVTDPPPLAVPELSTWAMLLLGFVGLSYAGYRKARTSATLAA
jgi:hypothetical protein